MYIYIYVYVYVHIYIYIGAWHFTSVLSFLRVNLYGADVHLVLKCTDANLSCLSPGQLKSRRELMEALQSTRSPHCQPQQYCFVHTQWKIRQTTSHLKTSVQNHFFCMPFSVFCFSHSIFLLLILLLICFSMSSQSPCCASVALHDFKSSNHPQFSACPTRSRKRKPLLRLGPPDSTTPRSTRRCAT